MILNCVLKVIRTATLSTSVSICVDTENGSKAVVLFSGNNVTIKWLYNIQNLDNVRSRSYTTGQSCVRSMFNDLGMQLVQCKTGGSKHFVILI